MSDRDDADHDMFEFPKLLSGERVGARPWRWPSTFGPATSADGRWWT